MFRLNRDPCKCEKSRSLFFVPFAGLAACLKQFNFKFKFQQERNKNKTKLNWYI